MPGITRRTFLHRVAMACAGTLAGCATGGVSLVSSAFSFGPASAEVTSNSALVWFRASDMGLVQVEYGLDPGLRGASVARAVEGTPETDYTLVHELTGLLPDRQYFYRGVLLGAGPTGRPTRGPIGRFRTAPEAAQAFTFAWSGDMEAGHQPFTLFDRIVEKKPHFFILLGDTTYADRPRNRAVSTLAGYRSKHRENRADPHLQRLLANMPVYAIWDDHEVQDGFDRTNRLIPLGCRAFREYWPIRSLGNDHRVLYRQFSWGGGADIFILDCRQYRSPMFQIVGRDKTMLGRMQKEWFKQSIRASRAPFKFVISSVPFLGSWGLDTWAGYTSERAELLRFFHSERITGIIILSADVHAAADVTGPFGLREFLAGPIAAWPRCQHGSDLRSHEGETSHFYVCDTFNYGLVSVRPNANPPEVEVQILDGNNAVRHRARIHATPAVAQRGPDVLRR
ncbi:MAG: alkaline phosphatase D family protein [Nitrospiraceae bacterium]